MNALAVNYLLNTFLLRTRHFYPLNWGKYEWQDVVKFLAGGRFPDAVQNLEQLVCQLANVKYAFALNYGTSAIQVALEALNLPPGSEVIVPSFSCEAMVLPAIKIGLKPVLADVDQDFNLRIESAKEALNANTSAIIFAHLSGKFAHNTTEILALARQHGLKVIEDAAQSFGLKWRGKWTGTLGDIGIFSFGEGKHLFGPGGGMLITNDETVNDYCRSRPLPVETNPSIRFRLLRFIWRYGLQRITFPFRVATRSMRTHLKYLFPVQSPSEYYTYTVRRISEIEAILAHHRIEHCSEVIQKRQANGRYLLESEVLQQAGLQVPDPVNHIFTKFLISTGDNEEVALYLRMLLRKNGIETEPSYKPLHLRPSFTHLKRTSMQETERRWRGAFSLPVNPCLNQGDMDHILSVVSGYKR